MSSTSPLQGLRSHTKNEARKPKPVVICLSRMCREGTSPVLRREGSCKAPDLSDYNTHLLKLLHLQNLSIWFKSSLQIKQAGGMQRGKTDRVDAQRIAQYAYRFQNQMRLWEPPREVAQSLAFLSTTRQRLSQAYNLLAVPLAEQETFISRSLQKTLKGNVKKSLLVLKEEQKAVEQAIKQLIEADIRLKELFDLMVSVPGIGPVIATELLITTNKMKTINDLKKLACHAGVAPFVYRSGSSIRGKTRVSHQA